MTTGRDNLTKAEAVLVAAIEAEVPALNDASSLLSRFQAKIRNGGDPTSTPGMSPQPAARNLLSSFARGLLKDKAVVAAALMRPSSNGQSEGEITRLKLVKRQMFGRAKLDLLEARLIGAT